jgi:arginine-tRNA-protein transferase
MPESPKQIRLGIGPPTTCNYFADERAQRTGYIFERSPTDNDPGLKFALLQKGFLANAIGAVANLCPSCTACVPLRTNLSQFSLSASQRRLAGTQDGFSFELAATARTNVAALFPLFRAYTGARHAQSGSDMHRWPRSSFTSWMQSNPLLLIAKKDGKVAGFSLLDSHKSELSLDYSVFSPDYSRFSLGTRLWLQTMQMGQRAGMDHVYVGSWAKNSPKLSYKQRFKGLEAFRDGEWLSFDPKTTEKGPNHSRMLQRMGILAR